jgi:hypothetical protein
MKRQLYLDLSKSEVPADYPLPEGMPAPKVIPIRPGRHYLEFDACENLIPEWRPKLDDFMKRHGQTRRFENPDLPSGFDRFMLPEGAAIVVLPRIDKNGRRS